MLNRIIFPFLLFTGYILSQSPPADITLERDCIFLKGKFFASEREYISPTIIMVPGFPGNETDVIGLGSLLSAKGVNVLIFNYSGTFNSGGEFSFRNNLKDICAAYGFINKPAIIKKYNIDTSLIYLGGYSHGGGMALAYASLHPEVKAVFSIAGNDFGEYMREYMRSPEMKKTVDENFDKMIAGLNLRYDANSLPKNIAEKGIENIDPIFDIRRNAAHLTGKDILLIGGWDDEQATIDQYILPLYRALQKENADQVMITAFNDNHSFKNSREKIAVAIINWLKSDRSRTGK